MRKQKGKIENLRKHNETACILLKIQSNMVKLSKWEEFLQRGNFV